MATLKQQYHRRIRRVISYFSGTAQADWLSIKAVAKKFKVNHKSLSEARRIVLEHPERGTETMLNNIAGDWKGRKRSYTKEQEDQMVKCTRAYIQIYGSMSIDTAIRVLSDIIYPHDQQRMVSVNLVNRFFENNTYHFGSQKPRQKNPARAVAAAAVDRQRADVTQAFLKCIEEQETNMFESEAWAEKDKETAAKKEQKEAETKLKQARFDYWKNSNVAGLEAQVRNLDQAINSAENPQRKSQLGKRKASALRRLETEQKKTFSSRRQPKPMPHEEPSAAAAAPSAQQAPSNEPNDDRQTYMDYETLMAACHNV